MPEGDCIADNGFPEDFQISLLQGKEFYDLLSTQFGALVGFLMQVFE